jgi:hypothetical protein
VLDTRRCHAVIRVSTAAGVAILLLSSVAWAGASPRTSARRERREADEKAGLEQSAILLKDAKTGEYLRAVPSWQLPSGADSAARRADRSQGKSGSQAESRRFYYRRRGRYIKATPLDDLLKEHETGK